MTTTPTSPREGLLSPAYVATTVGLFSLIAFAAFEAMAVTTVMPTVARDLDGFDYYALAFAAPFASGVVGMVASGMWTDRSGALRPLFTSMAVFSLGLVVCGTAPSMEVLVVGRVLQGLGSGAMVVAIYVVVGLIYPAALRPAIFASFAAAWVLPALFGPAVAAFVADAVGWRWVFLGMVALVALAAVLVAPSLRSLPTPDSRGTTSRVQLWWAVLAAAAVLSLELLGSGSGLTLLAAAGAFVLVIVGAAAAAPGRRPRRAPRPAGRHRDARPAQRGLLLRRGLHRLRPPGAVGPHARPGRHRADVRRGGLGGLQPGVVTAGQPGHQRRRDEVRHDRRAGRRHRGRGRRAPALARRRPPGRRTDRAPTSSPASAWASPIPRTSVAMLAVTTDADRGFNSSALSVADSLGAALALSLSGIAYAVAVRSDVDPFPVVYAIAVGIGVLGVLAARRTAAPAA